MPTLLGHSSHDHDFYLFNSFVNASPAARGFDTNYVKACLEIQIAGTGHRAYLRDQNWGGAARADLRVQFMLAHNNFGNFPTGFGQLVYIKDIGSGRNLFRLHSTGSDNNVGLYYNTSSTAVESWTLVGAVVSIPNLLTTHTLTIYMHASAGILQWHINGALAASRTGLNTIFTSSTDFDAVDFGPLNGQGSGGYFCYAEHILGSYDFPTYGLRDVQGQITAAGTTGTQNSGIYSDVNELVTSTASAMAFSAAGQRFSGVSTDLPGVLATSPILNVRTSALVRPGVTGPSQGKLGTQQTGGLQLSGAITPGGIGFSPIAANFALDQGGVPWTYANYNAAEPAFEAA